MLRIVRFAAVFLAQVVIMSVGIGRAEAGEPNREWRTTGRSRTGATPKLRGYGAVAAEFEEYASRRGERSWVARFLCSGERAASAVVGKYLADLAQSHGARRVELGLGGESARARQGDSERRLVEAHQTASGAVFVGCVEGAEGRLIAADSLRAFRSFVEMRPELVSGAVGAAEYPMFLDRLERWGWGFYGFGDYRNIHNWMGHTGDRKELLDPVEDLDFLAEQRFRFEAHLDPLDMDASDGLVLNTGAEWEVQETKKRGMPISFRVYANAGLASWSARRFGEYMEEPAPFMMSGWYNAEEWHRSNPHMRWYDPDIHRYIAVKTMDMMRKFVDEPHVLGWMHPHGELQHNPWYDLHDDYSEAARASWCEYLRDNGVDLAEATRMYLREHEPFADWDQVPVPEYATFAGLPGQVLSLAGEWFFREEHGGEPYPDDWWTKSDEERYRGIREAWWREPLDAANWRQVSAPGVGLFDVFYEPKRPDPSAATTWFRRRFVRDPARIPAGARLYLYWFPMSHDSIHSGPRRRYHGVYLNGRKAGEIGSWGALDVTGLVKAGENEVALHLLGCLWDGRIFLSTEEPKVYPYLGPDRNRLWILWRNWHVDCKYRAWTEILDGMRQVDPDRPIKFMAPMGFGADRWLRLASSWGGFPHFTGEGIWFFPWYKRYAFLYGVPATSELAGPATSVPEMFEGFRRTFLAGLDGHEPVFMAQVYTRNPELRQWLVDHNPVLKKMGTYDISGPQVLLYRRSSPATDPVRRPYPELGIASREIQVPWDWDIGRGSLQTIGQSYLYLDDGGLADGKMYGYRLMMDCGNETVPPESVRHIESWVRAGGTFVTLPFTGRNSPEEPDTWPIRELTGCGVRKLRRPGTGSVTVLKRQSVFRALAGRTLPDAGCSVDWLGNDHNILSVELDPGPGCEVLAEFENGSPAIVRRALGKGAVIAMGSAFWRDSQDRRGIWWPGPRETEFLADLLEGLGFDAPFCSTDDRLVWAQPYRSNNGLEDVAVLVSWHDDRDVDVRVRLRTPVRPAALVSYGVDGVKPVPFEWREGAALATVPMPRKEAKILCASTRDPGDAIAYWWERQARLWRPVETPRIDFSPYTKGKWKDPTLDLAEGARIALEPPPDGWASPGFDDAGWKPARLGILTFGDVEPNSPVWVRRRFTVPDEWNARGGRVYLVSGCWAGPHYMGSSRMFLNGAMLHDYSTQSYHEFDVTRMLREGENVVAFQFAGDGKVTGFQGNVFLYHRAPPAREVSLRGVWRGTGADGAPVSVELPGKGVVLNPSRGVTIPAEWQGRYRVRLYMEETHQGALGAWVNKKYVRRHHHVFGNRCDLDITNALRFGEENQIVLAHRYRDRAREWDVPVIRLDLFERD